jgi:hypothetical protein
MKVEILEFYLHVDNREDDFINGDMKIRLPELGIDILGRKTICKKTGLPIQFPYLVLSDKLKQKELFNEILKAGSIYIENLLKKQIVSQKTIEEPKPIQSVEKIISKTWDSPPPLKVRKRNTI